MTRQPKFRFWNSGSCSRPPSPPPSGLVSWWTGDNTTADMAGANSGTLSNGANYAAGEVAAGFNFDGVNGNFQAPTAGLPTGSADRTIELWVRINQQVTTESLFASYGAPGTQSAAYGLGTESDGRLFASTWGSAIFGPALQNGQWYHVAVTNVGQSFTLYLNGAQVATGNMPVNTAAGSTFWMGRDTMTSVGDTRRLDGMVDEVAVYNRALNAAEIQAIYNAGSAGKIKSPDYIAANFPSIVEPTAGTQATLEFTINRIGSTAGPLSVDWNTADGTAQAGRDYVAASGTVVFADGQSQQTVDVTVYGDGTPTANETLNLILSPPPGVTASSGQGTIVNVDTAASIGNVPVIEGDKTVHNIDSFVLAGSGGLTAPKGMVFGPDGDLFVASDGSNSILRYDRSSGTFLGAFVAPGAGGLVNPHGLTFGPDGNLYVSSRTTNEVLRFDGTTGACIDTFVSAGSDGLSDPRGIAFGPDGSLYVASNLTNQVLKFQGPSGANPGAFLGVVASTGANSMPIEVAFGPDGNLYVSCTGNGAGFINRYTPSGSFLGTFIPNGSGGLASPRDVTFDQQGNLYVTDDSLNAVLRYQGPNGASPGAFIDIYVASGLAGLNAPIGILFGADGNLYVSSKGTNQVLRYGVASQAVFTVTLSAASAVPVAVDYATSDGSGLAGTDYVATSGTLSFGPGETTKTILVKTLSDGVAAGDKTFTVNLSNPSVDLTLTNTQGTGTIRDGETKFRVVNAASSGTLYDYGSTGAAVGSSALSSSDTTPLGMASNAAGTMTWVVDASRKVYVYNSSGALLGSWSPGSLKSTADVEGLATNGTDIWLVDAKLATVYRYAGAAGRLSGSQNAASSFRLAGGDSNAKGIVANGSSLWTVDGSSHTVFKYTLSGTLLGSWTIDAANAHPTGITINPNSVSDIWIVDSGTDKVYQYVGAASRTTGSQNAAASFALATGDTNPQDIADPPVIGGEGTPSSGAAGGNALPPDAMALAVLGITFDRGTDDSTSTDGADSHFAHLFGKARSMLR